MIDLITGLPGNSKTLFVIAWLRKFAKDENRQVFYSGIALTEEGKQELGWIEINPMEWMEVPPNSIVVVDECQKIFRNRSLGQVPGKHVTDLETHRHLGIDLVFITQHPSLIDPAIRRLTGRHRHFIRIWGSEASTVHKWDSVRDNCDKSAARKDSEKLTWKFDKSVYPLYKSAEVHTVKRSIPLRVKLLLLVPFILIACGYGAYKLLMPKKTATDPAPASQNSPVSGQVVQSAGKPVVDPIADAKQYMFMQTPRVADVAYTAPKYDELTKPTAVPVPAACIHSGDRCKCYTQQATPLNVPRDQCIAIAHDGYFQEFEPQRSQQDSMRTQRSVAALDDQERLPLSGASTRDYKPLDHSTGYGVLGSRRDGIREPGA